MYLCSLLSIFSPFYLNRCTSQGEPIFQPIKSKDNLNFGACHLCPGPQEFIIGFSNGHKQSRGICEAFYYHPDDSASWEIRRLKLITCGGPQVQELGWLALKSFPNTKIGTGVGFPPSSVSSSEWYSSIQFFKPIIFSMALLKIWSCILTSATLASLNRKEFQSSIVHLDL